MGGGFIEFLFGEGRRRAAAISSSRPIKPQPDYGYGGRRTLLPPMDPQQAMRRSRRKQRSRAARVRSEIRKAGGRLSRQGKRRHHRRSIRPNKFLFLVQGDGKALRYGIGVGRPGFTWSGVKTISAKKEWPDWTPPPEMLARRPDLPRHMAGGPENPLGARAMYLGSSLYRIHGSNEPWTIGTNVSSGCIRMRNEDVIDLYGRVKVGAKVVVI